MVEGGIIECTYNFILLTYFSLDLVLALIELEIWSLYFIFSGTECPPLRRRMVSRSKGPATWMLNALFCSCSTTRYHPFAQWPSCKQSFAWMVIYATTTFFTPILVFQPPQYKLDPRLARLLGVHTQTRASIMQALWLYIKNNKLQDCHEKEYINCNRYFRQVMECFWGYAKPQNASSPLMHFPVLLWHWKILSKSFSMCFISRINVGIQFPNLFRKLQGTYC